ncbi:MAG: radical SAM family heme chaperone HemW [Synergistes sp.]|nr:radical SAM family heme chaperone HemW [Synergistes sp.]
MDSIPESLYVHIPFCARKCNYCAFESYVPHGTDRDDYIAAAERELKLLLNGVRPILRTCYFGGGTPTMLSARQWQRLFAALDDNFVFADDAEVTIEANPNSLCAEQLLAWRDWRVTRVSVGVQSFDDAELEMMGRLHTAREAHCAISAALASGFDVSADFIFALPHQTFANWHRTLHEAVRSGLSHISLYQLTIEEGTPWENIPRETLPDGYYDYRWAQWYLPHKGYGQYEVANFAKAGHESRHNMNYWNEGSYYGIGPAAASYIRGTRSKNYGRLNDYISALNKKIHPTEYSEHISGDKLYREAAILALRTNRGIKRETFTQKYGNTAYSDIASIMEKFPHDLYEYDDIGIRLTKKGMRLANVIWEEIV